MKTQLTLVLLAFALATSAFAEGKRPRNPCWDADTSLRAYYECRILGSASRYQKRVTALARLPGCADPNSTNCTELASGPDWVTKPEFRNDHGVDDLSDRFKPKVKSFLGSLDANSVLYSVESARRPPDRAWMMRISYDLCVGNMPAWVVSCPKEKDGQEDCDGCANRNCKKAMGYYVREGFRIDEKLAEVCDPNRTPRPNVVWGRSDPKQTRAAACDMMRAFDVAYRPSLTSFHMTGDAIDLSVVELPNSLEIDRNCANKLKDSNVIVTSKSRALLCYPDSRYPMRGRVKTVSCPFPEILDEEELELIHKRWGDQVQINDGKISEEHPYLSADDAAINPMFWAYGERCFGIIKHHDDFPHWSVNGE